jgi:hypothetical protein
MANQEAPRDAKKGGKGPQPVAVQASRFQEYLYVNLIFWGFLVVLCLAVYVDCVISGVVKFGEIDEVIKQVFQFILLVFGGGFTAVSIFDALYDRFAGPDSAEPAK